MDADIHWLLTRVLNSLIKKLDEVKVEKGTPQFKAASHRGSIRYSRTQETEAKLTTWLNGVKEKILENYGDGPLSEVLDLLEGAYQDTFRYAFLTGNEEALQILSDSAKRIKEKYDSDIPQILTELAETEEITISTDLDVSASKVNIAVRTADLDPSVKFAFQGAETLQLPRGEYDILAEYDGVHDKATLNVGGPDTIELELREKLRKKQKREAEKREEEEKKERDRKKKQKEKKGYTHPLKRGGSASKKAQNPSKHTTTTKGGKKRKKSKNVGIFGRIFKKWGRKIRWRRRRWSRKMRRMFWRTYHFTKTVAIILLVGTLVIGYVSPSVRTHLLEGNPAGITDDAADLIEQTSEFLSTINLSASQISNEVDIRETEQEVHNVVNLVRKNDGLDTLVYDEELSDIARRHSKDMAAQGRLSHTSSDGRTFGDRYQEAGYKCEIRVGRVIYKGAENIAMTFYQEPLAGGGYHNDEEELAEGVVRQWMNSEGHRENILTEYWEREGIGVYQTTDDEVYVTQNFC